jgi:hypothetical protein
MDLPSEELPMIAARTAILLAALVALGLAGAAACGSSESSDSESQVGVSEAVKTASPTDAKRDAAAVNPFCNARAFDGGCAYIH